jgi:hypothetical protein
VVVETAVAVLLVVGAGLLIRSFARLTAVDPGFRPQGVLALQVALPSSKYTDDARQAAFTSALLEKLQALAQRTREMGLRMALGAQPGTVLGMVLKEAGVLAGVGLAAGLVLALAATRVMASLLFRVPATDPTTFAAVALALAVVSLAAAYVPGRRATRVDPMVALRTD